jgi:hypothetical protein
MARSTKAPQAKMPAGMPGRKPDRPSATAAKTPDKAIKAPAAVAPKRAAVAAPAFPKPSKDELRARVEELERANATLRAKSREANRAAKTAAARIAELEDQVAQLEKQAVPPPAPAERGSKPTAPARGKRQRRSIDPGDAVPEGVAVQEPEPLDEAAETALENLNEHLGPE